MNDLLKFLETEFEEGMLVPVDSLSSYPIIVGLPPGRSQREFSISDVPVEAVICLRHASNKLIGEVNIRKISPHERHERNNYPGLKV